MRNVVRIGDRQVEMLGNAATALLYKQTFREDLLRAVASLSGAKEEDLIQAIEKLQKLAFIMNQQATKEFKNIVNKLTEEDFILWLSDFEETDFQDPQTFAAILSTWNKNLSGSSESKNA